MPLSMNVTPRPTPAEEREELRAHVAELREMVKDLAKRIEALERSGSGPTR